ncbi:hypothetical protein [Kribbella deserti]|uniref:Uncharacterized protein n=1 Tax=Kribbella deserti TaxID=1926257 RepID=A0ABV6QE91_9ACTN
MKDVIAITYDAGTGGPSLTAQERRQIDSALFQGASGTRVFSGIRGGNVSNTGFAVTIQPLTAVIEGATSPTTQGVYRGAFPAGSTELSKTIAAAHATLPRIDALDVKLYDHEADGSGLRGIDIVLTAGTANGSPSAPALTGASIRLGTFAVPAAGGGNPVFTPNPALIKYAAAGGILTVAQRPAFETQGLRIYRTDVDRTEIWTGSAWRNELAAPWVDYNPVMSSPGGNMAINNGQLTGRWRDEGNMADWKLKLVRGSTTNFGTGVYAWTLPFNVADYDTDAGTGYYILAAAPANRIPVQWYTVSSNQVGASRTTDGLRLGNGTIAWDTGAIIVLNGRFQKNQP